MTAATKAAVKELEALDAVTKGDTLSVELIPGVSLNVLPPKMWRLSAFRKMRVADIDGWAEECLATSADVQILVATNPTMEQFEQFCDNINRAADALGKSRK